MSSEQETGYGSCHVSYDTAEIDYICHEKNMAEFQKNGSKVERTDQNTISFTSPDADSLHETCEMVNKIRNSYYKPTIRKIIVKKEMVGYICGKGNVRLEKLKKKTGVQNVYFNDITDKNDVQMVEISVLGVRPCVHMMMYEIFSSVSNLMVKELNFQIPQREKGEKGEEKKIKKEKKSD